MYNLTYRDTFATKDYASSVVALIPTVHLHYPVSVVSARILAQPTDLPVVSTLCAVFQTIEQYVCVQKDTKENPVKNVTNWSVIMTTTVRLTNAAARMVSARILACNMVSVGSIHNVEWLIERLSALVHLGTMGILKSTVRKVIFYIFFFSFLVFCSISSF